MSWKQWLALLALFSLYLLFGGVIFMVIESPGEQLRLQELGALRDEIYEDLIGNIGNGTTSGEIERREAAWIRIADALNQPHLVRNNTLPEEKWTLFNSFFVAVTVASTIGYGHLSPSSAPGRLFCIAFALFGIPLNGILFATLGDYFGAKLVRRSDKRSTRRLTGCFVVLVDVILYIIPGMIIFLAIPAVFFSTFEGWNYLDSFYYAFISLTTIGFGDLVAGQSDIGQWTWLYRFGIIVWIFFGLGYLVMVINVITKGMRSRTLAKLEKKMVARIRATRKALARDGESLRQLVNQIKLMKLKPVYKTERPAIQRTASQPSVLPDIQEERGSDAGISLKNFSSSDSALVDIDVEATFTPNQESEAAKDQGRLLEDPVELLTRLATVLCEELDEGDCSNSDTCESAESEATQSENGDAEDPKPESALERFRRSLRRLSTNTISQLVTHSDSAEKSPDLNRTATNDVGEESTHVRRLSERDPQALSLAYSDSVNSRLGLIQSANDRNAGRTRRTFQRSFSESQTPAANREESHSFFDFASPLPTLNSAAPLRNNDETDVGSGVAPMSIKEFCNILDQVHLPSKMDPN